jgi:TM2 domain-containing membrane protein YozV
VANTPVGESEKSDKTRTVYIVLGIFLGGLGIHNFYAGRTGAAITQLLLTLFSWVLLFIPLLAVWIWVLVEICTVTKDGKGKKFL